MAFPGTYNINYYKGDTLEFRIYPKTADGSVFDLSPYTGGGSYDHDNNPSTPNIEYDNVMFVFAESRGSTTWHKCAAWIDTNKTYVGCAIRPEDSQYLTAGTTYFIIKVTTETFKLATTIANANAGTAINITDAGTGTHTAATLSVGTIRHIVKDPRTGTRFFIDSKTQSSIYVI